MNHRFFTVAALASLLGGCGLVLDLDPENEEVDAGPDIREDAGAHDVLDASFADVPPPDAIVVDANEGDTSCVPAMETCNGVDDDCDGIIDNSSPTLCPLGALCSSGVCVAECPLNTELCGDVCADLANHLQHCGTCGNQCPAGHACGDGTCRAPIVGLSAGSDHTCVVRTDGKISCWGRNDFGQAGNGTRDTPALPTTIPGFSATLVDGGEDHTCASGPGGSAYCWGGTVNGRVGVENGSGAIPNPTAVDDEPFLDISAGQRSTLAAGIFQLVAWGRDDGSSAGRLARISHRRWSLACGSRETVCRSRSDSCMHDHGGE